MAPVELQHFKPLESSLAASLFNLDYLCIVKDLDRQENGT